MLRVDVLTATRAEYGLMKPLLKKMNADEEIEMHLLVTGTHLSSQFGMTVAEIEEDGYENIVRIEILSTAIGVLGTSETMASAIVQFTKYFEAEKPDLLFVTGDRYETLAVCIAAVNSNIPIVHNGGGCTTEGALDEYYRHAITKMSFLHFTSTELHTNRIIQMGENPDRVFTVGALGIENITSMKLLTKEQLEEQLEFKLDVPYAVVTFHPVTLESDKVTEQFEELLKACTRKNNLKYIFTKANADNGGEIINRRLDEYGCENHDRVKVVSSLGATRYLSALKYSSFVMGNSSSGLIEAPSFHIPTINIGERQRGRIQSQSVINCKPCEEEILAAIEKAFSKEFCEVCKNAENPYGNGKSSDRIIEKIKERFVGKEINLKKSFYDFENIREYVKL